MKKQKSKQPRKSASFVCDKITDGLAAAAIRKRQTGAQPTTQELRALRRVEQAREEDLRWRYYSTVPKRHYLILAGTAEKPRSAKVILDQAKRYNLPLGGRTVDLREVLSAFHDFLAANYRKLNAPETDDALLAGTNSPALERYRRAQADLAEMRRDEQRGRLLEVERAREIFLTVADELRRANNRLRRQFGEKAERIIEQALDRATKKFERGMAGHEIT